MSKISFSSNVKRKRTKFALEPRRDASNRRRRRATRKIRRVDRFGKIAKLSKRGKPTNRRRAAFILIYHKLTNCKVARAVERPKFAFFQPSFSREKIFVRKNFLSPPFSSL